IAEEHWQQRPQIFEAIAMRHLHLQHHNGDDNCDHSVTECLQASLRHLFLLASELTGNLTRTRVFSRDVIPCLGEDSHPVTLCSGPPNWPTLCDLRARRRTLTASLSTLFHRFAVVFSAF